MRFNILGGFLVLAALALLQGANELVGHPNSFYRANGYVVILGSVLLFAWPLVAWRRRPAEGGTSG
jgi:hypothetical protein